jgi:hypothetical protein
MGAVLGGVPGALVAVPIAGALQVILQNILDEDDRADSLAAAAALRAARGARAPGASAFTLAPSARKLASAQQTSRAAASAGTAEAAPGHDLASAVSVAGAFFASRSCVSTSAWQPSGRVPQVAAGAAVPGAGFGAAAQAAVKTRERSARSRTFTPLSSQIRRRLSAPRGHAAPGGKHAPGQSAVVSGSQASVPSSLQMVPVPFTQSVPPRPPQLAGTQTYTQSLPVQPS